MRNSKGGLCKWKKHRTQNHWNSVATWMVVEGLSRMILGILALARIVQNLARNLSERTHLGERVLYLTRCF